MQVVSAQYLQHSDMLRVVYADGSVMSVPQVVGNTEYGLVQEWVAAGNTIEPAPEKTLAEMQAIQLVKINHEGQLRADAYTSTYPDFEKLTWSKQEAEAEQYKMDATAPCPNLSRIALKRGIPLAELVDKVLIKANLFNDASADLAGDRQALEDRLYALPADATQADVDAIWWDAPPQA